MYTELSSIPLSQLDEREREIFHCIKPSRTATHLHGQRFGESHSPGLIGPPVGRFSILEDAGIDDERGEFDLGQSTRHLRV